MGVSFYCLSKTTRIGALVPWNRVQVPPGRTIAPSVLIFQLWAMAVLDTILYWVPIYYWSTYDPGNDDRSGPILFFAVVCCPFTWILALVCLVQTYRSGMALPFRQRVAVWAGSLVPLFAIYSTLPPLADKVLPMAGILFRPRF